uniref:Ig-like domain-containing protein n=2 Tax=Schistosoma mansoni TaxID=6183 RepID=A0A3Q0KS07_SCHMA
MTGVIQPNGKISLYFDNIPAEVDESECISKINATLSCSFQGFIDHEIPVPAKWIKSGTLVEYEVIGTLSFHRNLFETCQRATTTKMTCTWCEKGDKCLESNDEDTHELKVNDCRVEVGIC